MALDISSAAVHEKAPPSSLEAERALLGAVLKDSENFLLIADKISDKVFFQIAHQKIFLAMTELFQANENIDILTVAEKLRKFDDELLGPSYLIELTENCPVSTNVEHYAEIISKYFYLRRIIDACQSTIKSAYIYDGEVNDYIATVEKEFLDITKDHEKKGIVTADLVLESTIEEIEKNLTKTEGITGVPSGFYDLDSLSGGWQRSDLIIVAARPGMGKTAFALNCAANAMRNNNRVCFFTLEMSSVQLMQRVLASEAMVDGSRLKKGDLSQDERDRLMEAARRIYGQGSCFGIDETPQINVIELRSRCMRFKKERGLDLIIIDYLQLMKGLSSKQNSREREIAEISGSLKGLAKELSVPVIALAQLNRSSELRTGDKRPKLSDLRESGSLEQDADMILFVYRDDYYNKNSEEAGVSEIIVGKNRHGSLQTVKLAWQPHFYAFQNLSREYS